MNTIILLQYSYSHERTKRTIYLSFCPPLFRHSFHPTAESGAFQIVTNENYYAMTHKNQYVLAINYGVQQKITFFKRV